uniref:Guanylate kinase-like domain-containing protein n=1 Tax=Timema cristinae TaxID=61476 RepID=A0A7R9CCB2_TIMCR|nr:unnamed protein product [Timema cristinae]
MSGINESTTEVTDDGWEARELRQGRMSNTPYSAEFCSDISTQERQGPIKRVPTNTPWFSEPHSEKSRDQAEENIVYWSNDDSSSTSYLSYLDPWSTFHWRDDLWNDEDWPIEQLVNYQDLELTKEEAEGVLTERIIARFSSLLVPCPDTTKYVLGKLVLQNKNLTDISLLRYHHYLQYLDLSHNRLTDLTPLEGVQHLRSLDVSYNQLTTVLRFKAPWYLTYVNYSHNCVQVIDDLTNFWALVHLDMSHNQITRISGLQNLKYLLYLDISHNCIKRFENLSYLPIKNLILSYNYISEFEEGLGVGMKTMKDLTFINFNNNLLSSLALFQGVFSLRLLLLAENCVSELLDLEYLKSMILLEVLDLSGNSITACTNYKEVVLQAVPSIQLLDKDCVGLVEKLAARRLFRPGEHLCVAQMHTHLTLLQHMNSPDIGLDIHPVDQGHFPIVVLVGPLASNKNFLVQRLAHLFPDKIYAGVNHTSRLPQTDSSEVDGESYHFVSQDKFNEMTLEGKFLSITEVLGKSFGFNWLLVEAPLQIKEVVICLPIMGHSFIPPDRVFGNFERQFKAKSVIVNLEEYLQVFDNFSTVFHLGRDELAQAVAHHRVCVTHMDMTGALSLRHSGMRPYLVLALPRSEQLHRAQLKEKYEARICKLTKIISLYSKGTFPPAGFEESQEESYKVTKDIMKDCLNHVVKNSFTDKVQTISRMTYSLPTEVGNQDSDDPVKWKLGLENESLGLLTNKPKLDSSVIPMGDTSGCPGYHKLSSDKLIARARVDTTTNVYMETKISDLHRENLTVTPLSVKESQFIKEADSEEDCCVANRPTSGNQKQHIDIQTKKDSNLNNTVELFLQSVICTRESYLSWHQNNPGVFSRTIFTDDLNQALDQLTEFLKQVYRSQPKQRPVFSLQEDEVVQSMSRNRLEKFGQEMSVSPP